MSVMVQIRNVPSELHQTLKARAATAGMSLSEYLLNELRARAEIPTPEEMRQRLASLPVTQLKTSLVDAVRAERDRD